MSRIKKFNLLNAKYIKDEKYTYLKQDISPTKIPTGKLTEAVYTYQKRENDRKKTAHFTTKYISTIDTPYKKYILK